MCVYKSKLIYSLQADEIVTQIARPFTFNNCVIVLRCEHGRNKVANINCSNRSYRVITPAFCYLDSPFLFPITLSTFCLFFVFRFVSFLFLFLLSSSSAFPTASESTSDVMCVCVLHHWKHLSLFVHRSIWVTSLPYSCKRHFTLNFFFSIFVVTTRT